MKLSLATDHGIQVLGVSESIGDEDLQILRAGLRKLLKSGKNRVIVELAPGLDLSTEAIREISNFDLLARELAGRIVVAGVSPELKQKILSFATPPVVECFERRKEALVFLEGAPEPEVPAPGVETKAEEAAPDAAAISALERRIAQLEGENRALKLQVVSTVIARRGTADEAVYRARIESLEEKVARLVEEVKPASGAKP